MIPGLGLESPVHSREWQALVNTIMKPPLSTQLFIEFDWLSNNYVRTRNLALWS